MGAGGIANKADCVYYAAAPVEGEEGRVSGGVWIGKKNYKCVQMEDNVELEAGSVNWRFAAISEPKGGAHIVATGSTVIVGLYQEDKQQSSGNCKNAVMAFAEYLLGAGY